MVYRCLEEIDDDLRKELAIGCNQHVRQQGANTSDIVKEEAFNLFCTDEEKQMYLDDNNHDAELVEFCSSRDKFQFVIWRLVLKGNLKLILKESLRITNHRPWPSKVDEFLNEVYRVLKTRRLLETLDRDDDIPESVFEIEEEFKSMPWVEGWQKQITSCRGVLEKPVFHSRVSNQSQGEFVSGLVSFPMFR